MGMVLMLRELLLQMFTGEKFGRDSSWDMQLTKEIRQTDLLLEAALRNFTLCRLQRAAHSLEVGSLPAVERELR